MTNRQRWCAFAVLAAALVLPTAVNAANPVLPLEKVERITIPPLDVNRLVDEDQFRKEIGMPLRFAVAFPQQITTKSNSQWEDPDKETRIWRLRIASEGALNINLGFAKYNLPDGASLRLLTTEEQQTFRAFTSLDNADHGQLWTPPVPGSEIIVELKVPNGLENQVILELGSINIGYRPFGAIGQGAGGPVDRSGACNIDVVCPVADPWDLQIPGVAAITVGGTDTCTGFMVNNTAQDLTPYFQTAAHCSINSGNAASMVAFWNFQNSTCRPPGSPQSGQPGDGQRNQFSSGATWLATYSPSDVTLVRLTTSPDPAWQVSWLGWDRQGLNPPSGACIHHPGVDEKRITFYDVADRPDRPSHGSSWGCSAFPGPGDNSHIRVYWKLEGAVTEPGSSGSPLFDDNKRVIGQLHGGPSACGSTGDNLSDCYGRFSLSWTGGGTDSTRLSNWLDPLNTGALFLDTISGGGLTVAPAANTLHLGVVGGPFTPASVVYTLTNPTPNPINYQVTVSTDNGPIVLINGGTSMLSGTLPPTGGSTNVTVTLAANALAAGVYAETVTFTDVTNTRSTTRIHTIEIGQTNYDVAPANGLSAGGPVGGPFNGTQVYSITSSRPTPVQVQVSADQPWISINGGNSPVVVNLNGVGDSANVTIGYYGPVANGLAAGIYSGNVAFDNLTTPPAGNVSRPVTLDVGRFTYSATDVPQTINDNSSISSFINVTDAYCIGDVRVNVNITHTYIGDLIVELRSPQNTTVRLHNRTGGSTDNLVRTYGIGYTTPDGPGTMADFNGEIVTGQWRLLVSDNAGADTGSLNSWSLQIASSGAVCPPEASNVSVSGDGCTNIPITLSAVSQNPGSLVYIIQSLPANGQLIDPNGGPIAAVPYTLLGGGNVVLLRPQSYFSGSTSFTYKANDGQDSNVASVSAAIGTVAYDFPMNANPGWTADPDWGFGQPTGTCGDPSAGYTGINVYGYNLAGCYPNSLTPTRWLTTTPLNLTGWNNPVLEFRRWLAVESSTFDQARIELSTNGGGSWAVVWQHSGSTLNESAWSLQTYALTGAANQANVLLRWGMGTTDGSVTYEGWNIDDVRITGSRASLYGDVNGSGAIDAVDLELFINVLLGTETNQCYVNRCDMNSDYLANGDDVGAFVDALLP